MNELHNKPETTDITNHDIDSFKDITPAGGMSVPAARAFIKTLFDNLLERNNEYYVPSEERVKYTPKYIDGEWVAERGNSKFIPSSETERGLAAKEKLAEHGLDGIDYVNNEPDFSKCSKATVTIDNMTENRQNYRDNEGAMQQGNFSQANMKCAEQFNAEQKDGKPDWTARDVEEWRQENKYSWHECSDTKTMQLVPREIHSACIHPGGVSECKARDNNGGGFDE